MFTCNRLILAFFGIFLPVSPFLSGQDVWIRRNLPDYGAVEHVAVSPNGVFYAQVFFSGFYRSFDEGMSWEKLEIYPPVGSGELGDLVCDVNGVLYLTSASGRIFRSFDDGVSWDLMNDSLFYRRLAFDSNYRMYLVTRGDKVQYSDDSGRTIIATPIAAGQFPSIHITKDDVVFIDDGLHLFRSTDHGITWVDIFTNITNALSLGGMCSDPAGNFYLGIRKSDDHNVWYVLRSTDDGETWTETNWLEGLRYQGPKILGSITPGTVLCVTPDNKVKRTTDYGETWSSYSSGMQHGYNYDLTFTPDGRAVTGSGGCIYITSRSVGVEQIAEIPSSLTLAQSYPNPVSTGQNSYINFSLPTQEYITLAVYNTAGQEVAQIAQGTYPPGTHTALFAVSGLPTGVYVYRLVAGGRMESRLLQVLR